MYQQVSKRVEERRMGGGRREGEGRARQRVCLAMANRTATP